MLPPEVSLFILEADVKKSRPTLSAEEKPSEPQSPPPLRAKTNRGLSDAHRQGGRLALRFRGSRGGSATPTALGTQAGPE